MFLVPVNRHSSDLARSFERLFDDNFINHFFGLAPAADGTARSPALDVTESDKSYTVALDLPGVEKDAVKVSIDGSRVSITAESSKTEEKKDGERVIYRERSASSFSRSFTLPQEIDQAQSEAKLDNGVLRLTLAKRGAAASAQLTVR